MDYFVWDTDPILLSVGPISVSWYGLFFFGSFVVGVYVVSKLIFQRENKSPEMFGDLFLYSIIGTLIGAKLMDALAYNPGYFLSHPLDILKVWQGGLSSHGGMFGLWVALWIVAKKHNESHLWLISRMVMPGFVVAFSVRLGNFFNSEILGKVTDVPWAVIFARVDNLPRHPVQLYEAVAYMILFILFVMLYRRLSPQFTSRLFPGIFFISMFTIRFLMEYTKTEQASYSLDIPLTTGQMLSIPVVFLGIIWTIWAVKTKDKISA